MKLNFNESIRQLLILILVLIIASLTSRTYAASSDDITFDDRPLDDALILPDWFKLSFLELDADIKEAAEQNKKGLIIYFGQKFCPYCKAHLTKNWGQDDIVNYTQKNFDVIAINKIGRAHV